MTTDFYNTIDRETVYTPTIDPQKHPHYCELSTFIDEYHLIDKTCLEIGSSKGLFQDMVKDYTGLDVAESLRKHYHKKYLTIKNDKYPFDDNSFDAIWTIHTFEHIHNIQKHLTEIARILRPGGVIFFFPAWYCSPFAAKGYRVRPYRDFSILGKIIKFMLPILDGSISRYLYFIPRRIIRLIYHYGLGQTMSTIVTKRIIPNYEHYWEADSDACLSLDPFNIITFFRAFDIQCISHPNPAKNILIRGGPLIFSQFSLA